MAKMNFNLQESLIYVGLDCETSSDNFQIGRPIEIGVSIYKEGRILNYSSLIYHNILEDWSLEAELIHKITKDELKSAPQPEIVDNELYNWLQKNLEEPTPGSLVAVGWNVNSFDFHFLKPVLSKSLTLFSRRVVELNSLIYLLTNTHHYNYLGFDDVKESIKNEAKALLKDFNIAGNEHRAQFDSSHALAIFSKIKDKMR